ncbi:MAG: benzoyl-CoA reductase subunit C [Gemmatimonadaceae bacterium]|nr:benzoyl-CoA reductase subunit C [Gemmatimonadaceae bacterium]
MSRATVVAWARELYEDLDFGAVHRWLEQHPGRKAAGYLPVYVPREVLHACGFLPVGIHGGGDRLEIIRGDAFYQSYICHLPRSVIELAQSGRLDMLSAVLFPSTCDVIRNLSGMWKLLYPGTYVRYIDIPQVPDAAAAAQFYEGELHRLVDDLGAVSGKVPTPEDLAASIGLYNAMRSAIRALYAVRQERPWDVPTEELYLLLRAGEVVPPEEFIACVGEYLDGVNADRRRPRDNSRVVIAGAFCEQPPLGLIKSIEKAGCYVVDDDFLLGDRFMTRDVPLDGDPLRNLADAFVRNDLKTSVLFEGDPDGKRNLMKQRADAAHADGIIFATPSFCDPALLDQPMLRNGAERAGLPCIAFKYAENTGQFQQFREQAGTFSDSLKLWGAA